MDSQAAAEVLGNLDEESAIAAITSALQSRPELAPSIVNFAVPELTYPPAKALVDRRAQGVIKSFNPEKGFGFIECPELTEVFGNDVFLHNRQVGNFSQGSHVSFAVVLNKDNKPQAYDLCPVDGGSGGGGGGGCGYGVMSGKMGCGSKGKGGWFDASAAYAAAMEAAKGAWQAHVSKVPAKGGTQTGVKRKWGSTWGGSGAGGGGASAGGGAGGGGGKPDEQGELGQFTGPIKSFNQKNGYGFIDCAELKAQGYNDVFLHHQQLGDHKVGEQVTFTAYVNSKGQPQAKDLQGA